MNKLLNLIWQTPAGDYSEFEFEYITKVLFNQFNQQKYFDHGSYKTFINNSVIIYSHSNDPNEPLANEFIEYINKYEQLGYNFYLLHLSNEYGAPNCYYYNKAKYVFRNYFYPELKTEHNNILFLPLGFKSGFLNTNTNYNIFAEKKELDFAFIGQVKSDREIMISSISKYKHFLHKTNQWNCPSALTTQQTKQIYENTKFVPCPMGNCHVDSFRICEALESNSIPVLKLYNNDNYSENIFPNNPFPKIYEWSELPGLLNVDYNKLFVIVHEYYKNFKLNLSEKINNIII